MMYPIITIAESAVEAVEPLGTKDKFWYNRRKYLFKQARPDTGEDWAEKVCAQLADRLGLPHAQYDLAEWETSGKRVRGVRSPNFCPAGAKLIMGNEVLAESDQAYEAHSASRFRVQAHTVSRVITALRRLAPRVPQNWEPPSFVQDCISVFTGYLLLDALAGNTDRHHENWGVIRMGSGDIHLAPTFDHASSLGRHLTDRERQERLQTRDRNRTVEAYTGKARSALYRSEADPAPLSPLQAFEEFSRADPSAATGLVRETRDPHQRRNRYNRKRCSARSYLRGWGGFREAHSVDQ